MATRTREYINLDSENPKDRVVKQIRFGFFENFHNNVWSGVRVAFQDLIVAYRRHPRSVSNIKKMSDELEGVIQAELRKIEVELNRLGNISPIPGSILEAQNNLNAANLASPVDAGEVQKCELELISRKTQLGEYTDQQLLLSKFD